MQTADNDVMQVPHETAVTMQPLYSSDDDYEDLDYRNAHVPQHIVRLLRRLEKRRVAAAHVPRHIKCLMRRLKERKAAVAALNRRVRRSRVRSLPCKLRRNPRRDLKAKPASPTTKSTPVHQQKKKKKGKTAMKKALNDRTFQANIKKAKGIGDSRYKVDKPTISWDDGWAAPSPKAPSPKYRRWTKNEMTFGYIMKEMDEMLAKR